MTVKELINWLEDFDDDAEVVIGMKQRYGSNFAMEIENVSEEKVDNWDTNEEDIPYVVITEGKQIGCVGYEDEEEDW